MWWWKDCSVELLLVKIICPLLQPFNLLWQGCSLFGVHDVVFIVKDFDVVLSCNDVALVDVNQVALLVSRQNDLVIDVKISFILDNVLNMSCPLHVIHAPVLINADMTEFLVLGI
jgi:hypothetical protein